MAEIFDFNNSEQYTLSIRLSTDGFSFSVYNPILDHSFYYIPYKIDRSLSMVANIKEMLQQNEFLKLTYKRIHIYIAQPDYIPVPFELFDEEEIEELYYQSHQKESNNLILHNILPKANVVMLYGLNKAVYQLLKEQFPEARFYSIASPLTEYFTGKSYLGNSKKLYAYLQGENLTVLCFERGKLLLLNSFVCKQTNDYIYYLLYIWKQLNYDQNRDELHLTGIFPEKDILVHQLRKYLRQVYIINPTAEFNRSEFSKIEEIPFDLQTSFLCDI